MTDLPPEVEQELADMTNAISDPATPPAPVSEPAAEPTTGDEPVAAAEAPQPQALAEGELDSMMSMGSATDEAARSDLMMETQVTTSLADPVQEFRCPKCEWRSHDEATGSARLAEHLVGHG